MENLLNDYERVRSGGIGFYPQKRGLFEVSGGEAVQFLNGLITNDVAKLEDGGKMLAAFPTLKGRVFAVVRVERRGDKYVFETEEATKQKVFDNLTRYTLAGDFRLKDISDEYECLSFYGAVENLDFSGEGSISFGDDCFFSAGFAQEIRKMLGGFALEISDELYEVLRIENGIPKYGIDMDEETVVPELNMDGLISYQKGCYIGQEVIARIHFKGKPAKQLRGLIFESEPAAVASGLVGRELKSLDGKNAGIVTSVAFSPKLKKTIALGYVRNAFLEPGTELNTDEYTAVVSELPFGLGE